MRRRDQLRRWWWLIAFAVVVPLAIWGWYRKPGSREASDPLSAEELRSITETLRVVPPQETKEFRISVEVERSLVGFYAKAVFEKLDPLPDPHELVPGSKKRDLGFEGSEVHPPWFGAYPAKHSDVRFSKKLDNSSTMYCLLRTEGDRTVLYLEGVAQKGVFPAALLSTLQKHPVNPYATVLGPRGKIAERIWIGDRLPFKPAAPPA